MNNLTIVRAIGEILVTLPLPAVLCHYFYKWHNSEEIFILSIISLWMIIAALMANGNLTLVNAAEILQYTQGK